MEGIGLDLSTGHCDLGEGNFRAVRVVESDSREIVHLSSEI